MTASPVVICGHDGCTSTMHRVPQAMRFYLNANDIHTEWMDENYVRYRARKKGIRRPRFSPDVVMKPGSGLPQKDYDTRNYRKELN